MTSISKAITHLVLIYFSVSVQSKTLDLSTIRDQQLLVRWEQKFLGHVYPYVQELENTIKEAKSFISTFSLKDNIWFDNEDPSPEDHLPFTRLLSYKLVNRMKSELHSLELGVKCHRGAANDLLAVMEDMRAEIDFPTSKDLKTSMSILKILFTMYELDLDEVEVGSIRDSETNSGLDLQHFYELGRFALSGRSYSLAVNLFEKSRNMARALNNTKDLEICEKYYSEASELHDQNYGKKLPFLFPTRLNESRSLTYKQRLAVVNEALNTTDHFYNVICREKAQPGLDGKKRHGALFSPSNFPKKCYLSHTIHPFWILNPVRVEVHSKDPFIVQFYDVLTSSQIQRMRSVTEPSLSRSEVVEEYGVQNASNYRISSTAVPDLDGPESQLWNRKVELLTGLKATELRDAEVIQITSYPTGGYFLIHADPFKTNFEDDGLSEKMENGDRIATFMYYLSTVDMGGRTGFPLLNLSVDPIQGSALFWYNLHPNGSFDERLVHTGCPVLFGSKWISTKWIQSHGQMFTQKCSPMNNPELVYNPWFYNNYGLE